jgi:HemY protein
MARRAGDRARVLELARRARALRSDLPWVIEVWFDAEVRAGNWVEAERALDEATRRRAMDAAQVRRARAVVQHARSLDAGRAGDSAAALEAARAAHEADAAAPGPAAHLARLLARAGETRRARRVIEETWKAAPHPELLSAYREALGAPDALPWTEAVQKLPQQDNPESRLALAEAALDARLWGVARDALAASEPVDGRAPRLAARLAEEESHDAAAAAALRAKAGPEPRWQCETCGAAPAAWEPVCGHCGAFDSLRWGLPVRSGLPALSKAQV